ncbi:MAG: hypothetical protein V2J08_04735 [Desulfotignum sp.]|jgi:hypothetical protein|nr:hypothetical protein [Desulfotignum sp.]
MSLAIIDAREWQNTFDLETGQPQTSESPAADMAARVLSRHPYPGDVDEKANQWVTGTALELIDRYDPDLVCVSYVQQFFADRHFRYAQKERERLFASAMEEAERFIEKSGFTPVIVGTGDMIPLKGEMDLSGLDGLAVSSNWSARYCGIHAPSRHDMAFLDSLDTLERIVSRNQWIQMFATAQPDLEIHQDINLMPDFLLAARQGLAFKTMGTTLRKPVHIPAKNFLVPVFSPLGRVDDLRDIKSLIRSHLPDHKIALILLEGVGERFFPASRFMCQNGVDWFCNEPGDAFYLTLSTGKHQPFAYPAGYRFFDKDADAIKFPFSGYMDTIPEHTLAQDFPGKSIAVGNRSMFMHMVFGVDISIECFARNLFNQGCMAVVNRSNK